MTAARRSKPDSLSETSRRIVESYRELQPIGHLGRRPLPGRTALIEIARELRELLFPGFSDQCELRWDNASLRVNRALKRLRKRLHEQIGRALDHDCLPGRKAAPGAVRREAGRKTAEFLESIPRIRRLLATDVQAAYDGDPAARGTHEIVSCYPGLEAVTVYRLAHELHLLGVPLIPRMMTEWAHGRTGIDIHPAARIGPGFFIDHGTGVVIGETCEIADHVKLYQGVTLGALSFQQDADGNLVRGTKRHPTIERKVVIYANATVLGGATVVGASSVIGAGVSITKSIPPNTVVTLEKPSLRFREAS